MLLIAHVMERYHGHLQNDLSWQGYQGFNSLRERLLYNFYIYYITI